MDHGSLAPQPMEIHLLRQMTQNFSEDRLLGSGSFGSVYKGVRSDGQYIAVKKLHFSSQHDNAQKFLKEYLNVANLQHENIVRLVGYCSNKQDEIITLSDGKTIIAERQFMALCFEYMPKGGLESYLKDESTGPDWQTRYGIIKGICKGLKYLHEELKSPLVHLDLKPENILLDENMVPKIADFGVSIIFDDGNRTRTTKTEKGTSGFIPPEFIDQGVISTKFDIFSLGLIIIEVMMGRQWCSRIRNMPAKESIEVVLGKWRDWLQRTSSTEDIESYAEQVKTCIEIALRCIEQHKDKRPTIGVIVDELSKTETMLPQFSRALTINPVLMSIEKQIIWRIQNPKRHNLTDIDVHPTEPWILASYYGRDGAGLEIWNYETKERVAALETYTSRTRKEFRCAKFVARKQWFLAGDMNGWIHVRACGTNDEVTEFKAHRQPLTSLAVHPSDPLLLSSSFFDIKLWNWEQDWKCIRTYEFPHQGFCVHQLVFNPMESSIFASAGNDGTVKIWDTSSDEVMTILECGHQNQCISAEFFHAGDDRQGLITGSGSGNARIWDWKTKTCIRQIEGLEKRCARNVGVVDRPNQPPLLLLVLKGDKVALCNSTTNRYEYENPIDFNLGPCTTCANVKSKRSVAVAFFHGVAMMEIN